MLLAWSCGNSEGRGAIGLPSESADLPAQKRHRASTEVEARCISRFNASTNSRSALRYQQPGLLVSIVAVIVVMPASDARREPDAARGDADGRYGGGTRCPVHQVGDVLGRRIRVGANRGELRAGAHEEHPPFGVTEIEVRVAEVTVSVADPVIPFMKAVTVAIPGLTPVANPLLPAVLLMVATVALFVLQPTWPVNTWSDPSEK